MLHREQLWRDCRRADDRAADLARVAVKPTPTIAKDQRTIDKASRENKALSAVTRWDPTIVPRVWPVAEAFMSMILLDYYMQHVAYQSLWRE